MTDKWDIGLFFLIMPVLLYGLYRTRRNPAIMRPLNNRNDFPRWRRYLFGRRLRSVGVLIRYDELCHGDVVLWHDDGHVVDAEMIVGQIGSGQHLLSSGDLLGVPIAPSWPVWIAQPSLVPNK